MIPRSELSRLDRAMGQVIAGADSQLRDVFSSLPLSAPDRSRDALLEAYPALVASHAGRAATASAEWYEQNRAAQRGGKFTALLGPTPDSEQLQRTVRWAADGLFHDNAAATLLLLSGSLERSMGDAQRDTISRNIRSDSASAGWHRIAHSDGCDFCVMLSQRGSAVYKRATADFASHDNCRCKAAPSWDSSAPEVDARAYEASERMGSVQRRATDPSLSAKERADAQRVLDAHRARTREWIEINRWRLDDFRAELAEF